MKLSLGHKWVYAEGQMLWSVWIYTSALYLQGWKTAAGWTLIPTLFADILLSERRPNNAKNVFFSSNWSWEQVLCSGPDKPIPLITPSNLKCYLWQVPLKCYCGKFRYCRGGGGICHDWPFPLHTNKTNPVWCRLLVAIFMSYYENKTSHVRAHPR